MKFLKSRLCAILAMCVLIAASLPVGACVSLSRERGNASKYFYGSDSDFDFVVGIAEDISWCSSDAANLVTRAKLILPANSEAIAAVHDARTVLDGAVTPGEKYAALQNLTVQVNALYAALTETSLSEEDEEYCRNIMASYDSDLDMISRNDYNTEAAHFNEMLETTPGGAVASLFGVKPLELFRKAPESAGGDA